LEIKPNKPIQTQTHPQYSIKFQNQYDRLSEPPP